MNTPPPRTIFVSCVLLLLAFAPALPISIADDWPQFRGPTGQGISTDTGVPTEWGPAKNVAWKVEIPGRGWSSPILSAGRIYLTYAAGGAGGTSAVGGTNGSGGVGGPLTLHALCLDATDGKSVWDTEVFRPDPAAAGRMHQKNSPASPTPIATADRLYVHFGHLGTAALDLAGKVVWRQTGLAYPPVHGNGGSPALVGDSLVFNCDGGRAPFIVALRADSGEVKWKTPRNSPARNQFSFSTPLAIDVGGATQIVSPASGFVGGYDLATGHELWRVRYGEGYSVVPRPVFADGLLFVSSSFDAPVVYAIRPEGAKGDATADHVAWTCRKGAPDTPSMLALGDELYFVSDNGIATCADAKTGKIHWTHRLAGGFSASPVAAGGKIYLQNETGVGFVLKAAKTFELVSENDLEERSLASYAVADHALLIRTEKHLWKIAAR